MTLAEAVARGNLEAPGLRAAEELETRLICRTEPLQGCREPRRARSGIYLGRFVDTGLRPNPRVLAQLEPLLDTNLRLPVPQITGGGQRRKTHLRQRGGFARRNNRLIL